MGLDAGLRDALLSTGMNRKDDRNLGSDGVNGVEEVGEFFCGIDVGRAMEGKDCEAAPVAATLRPRPSPMGEFWAMGRKWRRESIMTLPTR